MRYFGEGGVRRGVSLSFGLMSTSATTTLDDMVALSLFRVSSSMSIDVELE